MATTRLLDMRPYRCAVLALTIVVAAGCGGSSPASGGASTTTAAQTTAQTTAQPGSTPTAAGTSPAPATASGAGVGAGVTGDTGCIPSGFPLPDDTDITICVDEDSRILVVASVPLSGEATMDFFTKSLPGAGYTVTDRFSGTLDGQFTGEVKFKGRGFDDGTNVAITPGRFAISLDR